jgi:hypothetical protein
MPHTDKKEWILPDEQKKLLLDYAAEGNRTAMNRLIFHYYFIGEKACSQYWKKASLNMSSPHKEEYPDCWK